MESQNLEAFYYKGMAGRLPVKAEIEKHYSAKTPNFEVAAYEDFRVLLEKEKAVDAILCATPDHLHAYVSATAMRLGRHVYCEKPLTHNVWEARQIARIARETGVATQLGNQGHSGDFIRQTCEMIWDGAIGDVREVHAWTSATRWNKELSGRPGDETTPQGVNWDLWIGPRKPRGYSPALNPVRWRDFWDFGTAPIATFSAIILIRRCGRWIFGRRSRLKPRFGPVDSYIAPPGGLYTYHFGPRDNKPAVKFTWYEGGLKPTRPDAMDANESFDGNGILFIGDKGVLRSPGWVATPSYCPRLRMQLIDGPRQASRDPGAPSRLAGRMQRWARRQFQL